MQPKPPAGRGPGAGSSYQPPSAPPIGSRVAPPPQAPAPVNRPTGGSEQRLQSSNQYLRTPVVRYSSRMRVGKLHPLQVSLASEGGQELFKPQTQSGGFDPPIVVQVSVPGAIVTPPHVIVPISGGNASFVVQPLMSGKLPGAKVEFLAQGRKVSEIPLPMRANRGRLAKLLFLFAILLPFIIHFFPNLSYRDSFRSNEGPSPASRAAIQQMIEGAPERPIPQGGRGFRGANIMAPKNDEAPNKSDVPAEKDDTQRKAGNKQKEGEKPQDEQGYLERDAGWLMTIVALQEPSPGKQPPPNNKVDPDILRQPTRESRAENPGVGSASKQLPPNKKGDPDVLRQPTRESRAENPGIGPVLTTNQPARNLGPQYTGEDAIWAWTRNVLEREGYETKKIPVDSVGGISSLFVADRPYEIVGENTTQWGTSRLMAKALYYAEPVLRLLYRLFIVFPLSWQFGDLIYACCFLLLAGLIWLYTGPNRRKVKGPVMDIRLAGA